MESGFTPMDDQGFSGYNSLLPTDFDAITALNQMSNSLVQIEHDSSRRDARAVNETLGVSGDPDSAATSGGKRKGSLFSQVIGGVKDAKKNKLV